MRRLIPFLFVAVAAFAAEYLPDSSRITTWTAGTTVGIPSGIPARDDPAKIINVVTDYSADNTGATDATTAINNAIAAANSAATSTSNYRVVYFPAGTYRMDGSPTSIGSYVTIRGAGTGFNGGAQTKLDIRGQYGFGAIGDAFSQYAGPSTTVTTFTKGSATISVTNATGFSAGWAVRITHPNSTTYPTVSMTGADNLQVHVNSIASVNTGANTITLNEPMPEAFPSGATILQAAAQENPYGSGKEYLGVEDMWVEQTNAGAGDDQAQYGVNFGSPGRYMWVKNVKFTGFKSSAIWFFQVERGEVRACWADGGGISGSNKAGLKFETCTGLLVEDNVSFNAMPPIQLVKGVTGSAIAFNYFDKDPGGIGIHSNHDPLNTYNLYEGNCTPAVKDDGYRGGSWRQTYFRNYFTADNDGTQMGWPVNLKRFTYETNFVGNIVGEGSQVGDGMQLGYPNIGNDSYTGTANHRTDTTTHAIAGVARTWTGVLTTRTSDYVGVVTLDSGMATSFAAAVADSSGGEWTQIMEAGNNPHQVSNLSGSTFDVNTSAGVNALPAQGSAITLIGSIYGWQQQDTGVSATILRKANYYYGTDEMPAGESLGGDTLANSWFRSSKPDWFGNLPWPAYDSTRLSPQKADIPAGYRYVNGTTNYLSGGTTFTPSPRRTLKAKVRK